MKKYHIYLASVILSWVGWVTIVYLSAFVWDATLGQGIAAVFGGFTPVVILASIAGEARSKALGGKG